MKRILLAAAFAALSSAAYAGQCPGMMAEIDAALQTASISEEDKAKVMELRKTGEEQHASGDHAASEATLAEAKKLLGM